MAQTMLFDPLDLSRNSQIESPPAAAACSVRVGASMEGEVMFATKRSLPKSQAKMRPGAALREIEQITRRFVSEDAKLKLPLLDAAVAGIVLGFKPEHQEMRRQAARAWSELKNALREHIAREDEKLVPWAENQPQFPRDILERIEHRSAELRHLADKISPVDFEKDSDEAVADAGAALSLLAVKLDDLIESEEMKLLPNVRRAMFAPASEAAGTSETTG